MPHDSDLVVCGVCEQKAGETLGLAGWPQMCVDCQIVLLRTLQMDGKLDALLVRVRATRKAKAGTH